MGAIYTMRSDSKFTRKPRVPGPSSGSSSIKINGSRRILLTNEDTGELEDLTPLPLFPVTSEAEKNSAIDLVSKTLLKSFKILWQ